MGKRTFSKEAQEKARAARAAQPRQTRRQKMVAFASTFAKQRQEFPRFALPIIAQAEQGSLPALIKLKCLDCVCWNRKEVRDCVVIECPLFPIRPYQDIKGKNGNDPPQRGDVAGPAEETAA